MSGHAAVSVLVYVAVISALAGPLLLLDSPLWRRVAALVPGPVCVAASIPVGSTSWGARQTIPNEGINSGSDAAGLIIIGALTLAVGLASLLVAAAIRALRRWHRGEPVDTWAWHGGARPSIRGALSVWRSPDGRPRTRLIVLVIAASIVVGIGIARIGHLHPVFGLYLGTVLVFGGVSEVLGRRQAPRMSS